LSKQEDARRKAREDMARDLHRHNEKKGDSSSSYEKCQSYVNERADRIDAKRDRNIKE